MKHFSKTLLTVSALALLGLVGCGDGTPSKKDVSGQVRQPDPAKQVPAAGAGFKGGDNMGSTDKVGADGKPK